MLCAVCRRCGLCPGDGSFVPDENLIVSDEVSAPLPGTGRTPAFCPSDVGFAFDIGTTTVAAVAVRMTDFSVLARKGGGNAQRPFGSDVMARISYAVQGGHNALRDAVRAQLSDLAAVLYREVQAKFLAERRGAARVVGMTVTGNTAMLSLFCGYDVTGLSAFPFRVEGRFGFESRAGDFLSPDGPLSDVPLYVPPVVSPFIGADALCAMLSCGFGSENRPLLLADVGTNCEIALWEPSSRTVSCTSAAAGPAFEAQGMRMGMPASEGAIARVSWKDGHLSCSVIGGGAARGICGSGLLSACAALYGHGLVGADGAISDGADHVVLADGVRLYQSDIRSFQLAKSAVMTGISFLLESAHEVPQLLLAGGFGTRLSPHEASACGMIPRPLSFGAVSVGNAALSGAILLLEGEERRSGCAHLASLCRAVNLAELSDFEKRFIRFLNFPPL